VKSFRSPPWPHVPAKGWPHEPANWQLNQVEGFFGILGKQSLYLTDMPSKAALRRHIELYLLSWNENPTPFEWTKPAAAIIRSHKRMLDRISEALH
jgi:hypothetical protein